MRNAILLSLVGVIVISLVTIGAVYALPQEPAARSDNTVSVAISSEDTTGYPYLLRSYNGKLAVFTTDLVEPDMVFEVYVSSLPEYDKAALERGIRVEDFEKLNSLIEDYIS